MTPPPAARLTKAELGELARLVAEAIAGNGIGAQIGEIRDTVLRLEEQTRTDHNLVAKHETTLFGDEDAEGMVSQVRHLLRISTTATWIVGVIAGMLLTTAVGAFIYLVVTHPLSIP